MFANVRRVRLGVTASMPYITCMRDTEIDDTAVADVTGQKQRGRPFRPGQSGNPAGRPLGSRNKLAADFLSSMAADFTQYGAKVIAQVRKQKPDVYLRIVADMMPKQFEVELQQSFSGAETISDVARQYLGDQDAGEVLRVVDEMRAEIIKAAAERAKPVN